MTIDGTDFKINEPTAFDKGWLSHKMNHSGLRYEVGVCIQTGWICWINGPFPCGEYPDVNIFRMSLKGMLDDNERVEVDSGYVDDKVRSKDDYHGIRHWRYEKGQARARHENVNGRFKEWKCMGNVFRHDKRKHKEYFYAVATIVQSEIMHRRGTYQLAQYKIIRNFE